MPAGRLFALLCSLHGPRNESPRPPAVCLLVTVTAPACCATTPWQVCEARLQYERDMVEEDFSDYCPPVPNLAEAEAPPPPLTASQSLHPRRLHLSSAQLGTLVGVRQPSLPPQAVL